MRWGAYGEERDYGVGMGKEAAVVGQPILINCEPGRRRKVAWGERISSPRQPLRDGVGFVNLNGKGILWGSIAFGGGWLHY